MIITNVPETPFYMRSDYVNRPKTHRFLIVLVSLKTPFDLLLYLYQFFFFTVYWYFGSYLADKYNFRLENAKLFYTTFMILTSIPETPFYIRNNYVNKVHTNSKYVRGY